MLINFNQLPENVIPHMRGGDGQVVNRMHVDRDNKIMKGLLAPGCTIGLHTHDTSSEIIYILSGTDRGSYSPSHSTLPVPGRSTTAPRAMSTALSTTATAI